MSVKSNVVKEKQVLSEFETPSTRLQLVKQQLDSSGAYSRVRAKVYTQEYLDDLIDTLPALFADGDSAETICNKLGINHRMLMRYAEKNPRLREALDDGKDIAKGWWLELAKNVSAGKIMGNYGMISFILNNLYKFSAPAIGTGQTFVFNMDLRGLPVDNTKLIEHTDDD